MADSLKFMIELVDRMTKPASSASKAIGQLDAQLVKLKGTIGSLAAMPEVKLKMPKLGKGAAAPRLGDPNATGAADMGGAKMAQAAAKLLAAAKREEAQAVKAAEQTKRREMAETQKAQDRAFKMQMRGQKELEKAQKIAQKNIAKNTKDAEKAAKVAAAGQKKAQLGSLSGAFGEAFGGAQKATVGMEALGSSLGALANPVGLAVAATLALVAALAALGLALFEGAKVAIAASEAKNDTLDMLEAMLGTASAAQETYAQLSLMTSDLAVSSADLSALAQSLSAAGVDNKKQLLESVKAISQVDSVLKGSGAKIQSIVETAVASGKFQVQGKKLAGTGIQVQALYEELGRRMGVGVKEVEAQMKAGKISAEVGIDAMNAVIGKKFGPLAAKQALDFGAQMQRMKDNFGTLFEDVNTGPFLEALSKIVSLFDSTTPAGKALKQTLTTVFDGLFAAAGRVLPYVITFLKGMVLIGLKVWNALRPLGKAISDAFGGGAQDGPKSFADLMIKAAEKVGEFTAAVVKMLTQENTWKSIVSTIKIVAVVVGFLFDSLIKVIGAYITLEIWVVKAIGWLLNFSSAVRQTGFDIINGLIAVLSDPGRLYEVVTNLATGVLNRFKKVFATGSPSRKTMELGGFLTEGLSMGIDNGAKAANDSMANVINLDTARKQTQAEPAAATAGGGGTNIVIQIGENAVVINGANMTMEEVREQFPQMFADAIELALLSQGGGASVGRTGS